jgi:hypothetical protein
MSKNKNKNGYKKLISDFKYDYYHKDSKNKNDLQNKVKVKEHNSLFTSLRQVSLGGLNSYVIHFIYYWSNYYCLFSL